MENQMLDELSGFDQQLGSRGGKKTATPNQFYQNLQRQAYMDDGLGLVKLESEMTYDQARSLIHNHILDLDI